MAVMEPNDAKRPKEAVSPYFMEQQEAFLDYALKECEAGRSYQSFNEWLRTYKGRK